MSAILPAMAAGTPRERLEGTPAAEVLRAALPVAPLPTDGLVLLPGVRGFAAIPDGNRSALLPQVRAHLWGRELMLGVKGCGARAPLFGSSPLDDVFAHDFAGARGAGLLEPTGICAESWMGESPYGGQGEAGALHGLSLGAELDAQGTLAGAPICPVIAVLEVPRALVRDDVFWYRRHRGRVVQEHRLMPSDVRLFHSPDHALGRDPEGALGALGVSDVPSLDAFADRFLATGLAHLTLWARTARVRDGVLEGLDLCDGWLDKDCVIAPDGSLFFADLESLVWTPVTHRDPAPLRIRAQLGRNAYELLYGLDAILDVRDRWSERPMDARARRETVMARAAMALATDTHVRPIDTDEGLDLEIHAEATEPVRVRFVDRR